MIEDYLWPVWGVCVGFALSVARGHYEQKHLTKRRLGNLIGQLLRVENQLQNLYLASETIVDYARSCEECERIRKQYADAHFLEPGNVLADLSADFATLSARYPLMKTDCDKVRQQLIKIKNTDFSGSATYQKAYIRSLASHRNLVKQCQKDIQKMIDGLCWKHSRVTYLKSKLWYSRRLQNTHQKEMKIAGRVATLKSELRLRSNCKEPIA